PADRVGPHSPEISVGRTGRSRVVSPGGSGGHPHERPAGPSREVTRSGRRRVPDAEPADAGLPRWRGGPRVFGGPARSTKGTAWTPHGPPRAAACLTLAATVIGRRRRASRRSAKRSAPPTLNTDPTNIAEGPPHPDRFARKSVDLVVPSRVGSMAARMSARARPGHPAFRRHRQGPAWSGWSRGDRSSLNPFRPGLDPLDGLQTEPNRLTALRESGMMLAAAAAPDKLSRGELAPSTRRWNDSKRALDER